MAVLLSKIKKTFTVIGAAVLILNNCAFAYESDDFFNLLKKSQKKEVTQQMVEQKKNLKKEA